jgi:selenocysteine-specific translation elongation factor
MKNLAVGLFHDEELGRVLGKKGTESDIAMFNRKTEEYIFTFLSPVVDKLAAKS